MIPVNGSYDLGQPLRVARDARLTIVGMSQGGVTGATVGIPRVEGRIRLRWGRVMRGILVVTDGAPLAAGRINGRMATLAVEVGR